MDKLTAPCDVRFFNGRSGWATLKHSPRFHYMRRPAGFDYADSLCRLWRVLAPRFVPGEAAADRFGTARIGDRRCCQACYRERQAELRGLRGAVSGLRGTE